MQSIGTSVATLIAGFIITINAQGMLEHYNIVGYIACIAILSTLWLVGYVRVASAGRG